MTIIHTIMKNARMNRQPRSYCGDAPEQSFRGMQTKGGTYNIVNPLAGYDTCGMQAFHTKTGRA